MQFEINPIYRKIGALIGFAIAYCIFTTMLFFVLKFTGKLPSSWSFVNVIGITFSVIALGILTKRVLQ